MLFKLSLLALIAPLVSALSIQVPENPTSGGTVTIKWTVDAGDPDRFNTFTFQLVNVDFHDTYAIANNVDPSLLELTLTLPAIPVRDAYTIRAINIGNVNDVYATSGTFSVGAPTSITSGTSSTTTGSGTSTNSIPSTRTSSTGTSTTSKTSTSTSSISTGSTSTSGTSTGPVAPPFNSGSAALPSRLMSGNLGGLAAIVLSAVAGGAMLTL